MTNLLFESPFGGLRGNVRTSSIARWKAHSRLTIRDNWTFFASSCGWDVTCRYWLKSALFRGGWVISSANFRWKGTSPPNHCWYQKTRMFLLPHSEDRMILSILVWRGYQRVTDGIDCKQCGRAAKTIETCTETRAGKRTGTIPHLHEPKDVFCWQKLSNQTDIRSC